VKGEVPQGDDDARDNQKIRARKEIRKSEKAEKKV
jgi:hypothetical protein